MMINVKAHLWRKANGHMYSPAKVCKWAGCMKIDYLGETCGRIKIIAHLRGEDTAGFSVDGWVGERVWIKMTMLNVDLKSWKHANAYVCVCVLTTLRWHNVWTEPWEQWWILAAWSLQQETRNCCQVSTGWSAGYSDPLDRGGDCTTHKVSIWGGRDDGVRQQRE